MAGDGVAVLLMAYGGPGSLADVEPYLLDVRGGRPTSAGLVHEVRDRYAQIGGRSPILELTRAQAAGTARALGDGFAVYVGMRHWHPYIRETVDEIVQAGHRRLVGVVMAPHFSTMSVGAYEKKLAEAAGGRLETAVVRRWGDHPKFLGAVTAAVSQALRRFASPAAGVRVIFTAHSLPTRILAAGDPYPEELKASAAAVAQRLQLSDWTFAYQSAGATGDPWLGPDAGSVLRELAAAGHKNIVIAPIGFVCDHVEILYDVDIMYQALARELGIRLERTRSLNDDPLLMECLADLVREALAERGWK